MPVQLSTSIADKPPVFQNSPLWSIEILFSGGQLLGPGRQLAYSRPELRNRRSTAYLYCTVTRGEIIPEMPSERRQICKTARPQ
ncbi:hypothetical protein DTO280E4_5295 [Paecilomyces variotii]|nr:hypothetical protein DTO280E4_5295 [Paecilomyces variotii]